MGDGGEGDRRGHHTGSDRYYNRNTRQEKDSENKEGCLASVVYGGPNAVQVEVLREYKDKRIERRLKDN